MQNKEVKNIYDVLGTHIKSSDERIMEILSQFKNEDYLKLPIIFDLIVEKRIKILENLYAKGVPFAYQDAAGANALHVACGVFGSLEVVKLLTGKGILADINAKTDEGETPFLLAIMFNHVDIVNYFLHNFKPDLSICTIYGDAAFSLAQKGNNLEILALLETKKVSKKDD